jgi:hypothetical protein
LLKEGKDKAQTGRNFSQSRCLIKDSHPKYTKNFEIKTQCKKMRKRCERTLQQSKYRVVKEAQDAPHS